MSQAELQPLMPLEGWDVSSRGRGLCLRWGTVGLANSVFFSFESRGLCVHVPSDFPRAAAAPLWGGLIRVPLEGAGFTRPGDADEQSPSEGRQGWTPPGGCENAMPESR